MSEYSIKREEWSEKAQANLIKACDKFFSIDDLKKEVENRNMALFSLLKNGENTCHFVIRIDGDINNLECVVVCGGGHLKGASLFDICTPFINDIAKQCGAKIIRGHVNSKAKCKLMERAGYKLEEYIFRKAVI